MNTLDVYVAFVHGVQMLILDGLGIGLPLSRIQVLKLKSLGLEKVLSMCPRKYQLLVEKQSFILIPQQMIITTITRVKIVTRHQMKY